MRQRLHSAALHDQCSIKPVYRSHLCSAALPGTSDDCTLSCCFHCTALLLLQAAILTGRRSKDAISVKEIDDSVDRIVAGMEGTPMVDSKSKSLVAYHEVGHAVCGTLTPGGRSGGGASASCCLSITPSSCVVRQLVQRLPLMAVRHNQHKPQNRLPQASGPLASALQQGWCLQRRLYFFASPASPLAYQHAGQGSR